MPKYLSLFKYTAEGTKGFLKDKAAGREAAVRKAVDSIGTKLEAFYWVSSGEYSGAAIVDMPDAAAGAAFIAMVESTGAFAEFKSIEILTASEFDRALAKSPAYRPPGA